MKNYIVALVIWCSCISIYAQTEALTEAQSLISTKKYLSAYNVLEGADPDNTQPDIAIEKVDLVLDYFVSSIMHRMFALKDLGSNEDVMDYRGKQGAYTLFKLAPDSVLNRLIQKYPDNYKLQKTLGHYYHEVHLSYGENWLEPDSVVINRFLTNYKLAYQHGVFDYWSLYGIGYAYLLKKDYPEAISYLLQSLKLNSDYASGNYNLAYAYFGIQQYEKSIIYASKAMGLYQDAVYKSDATRLTGMAYLQLKDSVNAYRYYHLANGIEPDNYYTLQTLLNLNLAMHYEGSQELTENFFLLAPENPTIYQDLMGMYWSVNNIDALLAFFETQHITFKDNPTVNGNLYFYQGVINYDKQDYKASKSAFSQARKIFSKVYAKDHEVFLAIDSYIKEMK